MWRRVALIRTDDSEERVVSIFRVRRIRELETMLAVTSNLERCEELIIIYECFLSHTAINSSQRATVNSYC
jgi:hypothetical protein